MTRVAETHFLFVSLSRCLYFYYFFLLLTSVVFPSFLTVHAWRNRHRHSIARATRRSNIVNVATKAIIFSNFRRPSSRVYIFQKRSIQLNVPNRTDPFLSLLGFDMTRVRHCRTGESDTRTTRTAVGALVLTVSLARCSSRTSIDDRIVTARSMALRFFFQNVLTDTFPNKNILFRHRTNTSNQFLSRFLIAFSITCQGLKFK